MSKSTKNNGMPIQISDEMLRQQIMIYLIKHHQVPAGELSQLIGVGLSDLNSALNFLVSMGVIDQSNTSETSESIVQLRPTYKCIIGLDLGGTKLYGGISDLTGEILFEKEIQHQLKSGEESFDLIAHFLDTLIQESSINRLDILGIGIAVPGRVQLDTGVVLNAPGVGMRDYPLKERVMANFGCTVFIDNDLKQASLGESWFGAGQDFHQVVLLAVGTGIAASLVVDGKPLRGAHERLGELGWMVPGRDFLARKYVVFGALETEASGPGIESRAKKFLREFGHEVPPTEIKAEYVFRAAQEGHVWAQQCVDETADYLAVLVANIMAFYDPDIIILSGGVSRSSEMLIAPIMQRVEGCVLTQPYLVASKLGYRAGALGAVINLIQNSPEIFR